MLCVTEETLIRVQVSFTATIHCHDGLSRVMTRTVLFIAWLMSTVRSLVVVLE